ncbi:phosphohistidine phosphatase [Georgenia yuyongxinii]|uniref:Phosphohistidine phosphatase n=1 Tax=Georgenia yuyongxinii TaxID=2589797 RepID=A0A5B8C268_9MICO|nr:histidine phosphatase family protein [Georgenia yuyongxinii]QDC24428.1 phosphohistidine phosphatase [Georgenia yuyongxinii]
MARTLVLLRHAKAEPEGDLGDAMRPLAGKGRKQATALGPQLADLVGPVDVALVSSALRATETYKLVAAGMKVRAQQVVGEIYEGGPRTVLGLLQDVDEAAATVLVVGHEPTISGLASLLHDARDDLARQVSLGVPTATACVLQVPGTWQELDRSTAHLSRLIRPSH